MNNNISIIGLIVGCFIGQGISAIGYAYLGLMNNSATFGMICGACFGIMLTLTLLGDKKIKF